LEKAQQIAAHESPRTTRLDFRSHLARGFVTGEDGFEEMVERIASIEKILGFYDVVQLKPR
jgi:hypothetical protein